MELTLHPYQRLILKKLMYGDTKFSKLQITGLTSKHFNYHLKKLRELKLVDKVDCGYQLTSEGKMYVARLDEANMEVEKLPKVSVAVYPERINENGKVEVLINRRLKHPNYGKIVGIGGKVRFGEAFEETALRELKEETGLSGNITTGAIVRKIGLSEENSALLDIVFILFSMTNISGKLTERFEDQENFWCELDKIPTLDNVSKTLPIFIKKAKEGETLDIEYISGIFGY